MKSNSIEHGHWLPTVHLRWMDEAFIPGLATVIILTFNRERLLPDAFASVLAQTYRPIELIIVDDGSTDSTRELVHDYTKRYENPNLTIRYLFQENAGQPIARNLGLIYSRGEFIQFLDSDDVLDPQKLEIQISALQRNQGTDFVISTPRKFQGDAPEFKGRDFDVVVVSQIRIEKDFADFPGYPVTHLYPRRTCFYLGPWDERLTRWVDWEYCIRLVQLGQKGIRTHFPFYLIREHDTGRIADLAAKTEGIDSGIKTLEALEQGLAQIGDTSSLRGLVNTIAGLYLKLGTLALKKGTREQIEWCFNGAGRLRSDPAFQTKIQLLRCLKKFFGSWCAYYVIQFYSAVALKRQHLR